MQVELDDAEEPLKRCSERKRQKLDDTCKEPQLDLGQVTAKHEEGPKKRHTCGVCAAVFAKPAHLLQHMSVHTGERPFTCTHEGCTRSFKRQDHLNRHLKAHSGEALKCPFEDCPVTCSLPDNLRAHVKRHEKTASIKCSEQGCAFETAFKSQLWEHVRLVHEKRHACQEEGCGKRFKFRSLLAAHTAAVHGFKADPVPAPARGLDGARDPSSSDPSKVEVSELCGDGAGEAGSCSDTTVKGEAAASTGRWTCVIPGCPAHFELKVALKQHLTVAHLKEKVYLCHNSTCSSSFLTEKSRSRHAATVHAPQTCGGPQAAVAATPEHTQERSILEQPVFRDRSVSP